MTTPADRLIWNIPPDPYTPPAWREVNAGARARGGRYTALEKALARASWGTCGVGEHHRAQPHVVQYVACAPVDWILTVLGGSTSWAEGAPERAVTEARGLPPYGFGWAVEHDRVEEAERLLDAIDDRVLDLKRGGPAVPWPAGTDGGLFRAAQLRHPDFSCCPYHGARP